MRCEKCGAVVDSGELSARAATLEDGVNAWDRIATCPRCGSDELEELRSCALCGEPVLEDRTQFCGECRREIDSTFITAFLSIDWHGKSFPDVISLMFDRAEERNFYDLTRPNKGRGVR